MKEQSPILEDFLFSRMKHQEASKPIQDEQKEALQEIDVWLADLFPKMEEDRRKMHEIKPFEMRQFEELR